MRDAFEAGASWAWLLDDDCVPAPTALKELLVLAESGDDVAGSAPTIEFGDGRREAGWHWGDRAERGHGQSPNRGPGEIDWAPFAGLLLRREACEAVGELRADYVLWHADVEYCLRLRSRGWRLLAAPAAEVTHPAMGMIERRLPGRTVSVGRIPPWREYYDTRNMTLLRRQVRDTPLAQRTPLRRRLVDEVKRDMAVILADSAGIRRVGMRALGRLDGVRGHMDRRPEPR
jgi:GT2 family glycosyltransferase